MAVTNEELESFHHFVSEQINNGGTDSLEECLQLWRNAREEAETIASVQRSLDDVDAGRYQTLEEVDSEIRSEFGFPPRNT